MSRRPYTLILYFFLAVAQVGCSFQWLVRSQVDSVLARRVGHDMNLSRAQELLLREQIRATRAQLSPEIKALQTQLAQTEIMTLSQEELYLQYSELRSLYLSSAPQVNELFVDLTLSLDQNQRTRFLESLEKENQELHTSQEDEIKRLQKGLERLIGPLTSGQVELMASYQTSLLLPGQARLERRDRTFNFLAEALNSNKKNDKLRPEMLSFFNEVSAHGPGEAVIKKNVEFFHQLLASLTDKQKRRLNTQWGRMISLLDGIIIEQS